MKKSVFILTAVAMVTMSATANNVAENELSSIQPNTVSITSTSDDIQWISVELETPGSLGVEVLYKVNTLADVEYLKITGTLNDADWTTIKNMANLKGVDFRNAKFDAIPKNQFYGRRKFHIIYLPEGLKTIGESAFYQTTIETITFPASLTTIDSEAFRYADSLKTVTFANNSMLTKIGTQAFYECKKLQGFAMPNTVTSLGESAFYNCYSLKSVSISTSLDYINNYCFLGTSSLKNIEIPQSIQSILFQAFRSSGLENVVLPIGLTYLGQEAFYYCNSLKTVELPAKSNLSNGSYPSGYYESFSNCKAIEKVVCHSATPPSINRDPFYSVDRSKITLIVPAFAVVDYKLDTYWHNFGTIEEGAEPSYLDIRSTLSLTNNRRPSNKVDILLGEGGKLLVGGNAPMEVGKLTFEIDSKQYNKTSSGYGQLMNNCSNLSADEVTTNYYAKNGYWYFLTPMHDVNVNDVSHESSEASFVFRYYNGQNRADNGAKGSWQDLNDNVLKAGQGYIFQTNRDGWITMPATATGKASVIQSNDATVSLKSYASDNATNANWNFVGNPYPCYYDVYYMDFNAPITVWDYSNRTYRAYSIVDDNYVLSPMEAFFVQKTNDKNQILFQKEGRQFATEIERVSAPKRNAPDADNNRQIYEIEVSDGNSTDMARVVVNSKSSLSYEITCDATRFFSDEADVPQLFTIDESGNQLAINERPIENGIVRLGFKANKTGIFTLSVGRSAGSIQLTDALTGLSMDLSKESYDFVVEESGFNDSRFTLTLGNLPSAIETMTNDQQATEPIRYDLFGRKLGEQQPNGLFIQNGKKQIVK